MGQVPPATARPHTQRAWRSTRTASWQHRLRILAAAADRYKYLHLLRERTDRSTLASPGVPEATRDGDTREYVPGESNEQKRGVEAVETYAAILGAKPEPRVWRTASRAAPLRPGVSLGVTPTRNRS